MTSPFMTALKTKSPLVGDPSKGSPVYAPAVMEKPPQSTSLVTVDKLMEIGKDTGGQLVSFNKKVLEQQRFSSSGELGERLNSLIKEAKGLNVNGNSKGLKKLFSKILGVKEDLFAHFDTVEGRINALQVELQKDIRRSADSVFTLKTLREQIGQWALGLDRDLELLSNGYAQMEEQFALLESGSEEYLDMQSNMDLVEIKIGDAKANRLMAVSMGKRIVGMEATAKKLMQNGERVVNNVIPSYMANFSLYIQSVQQREIAQVQEKVLDEYNTTVLLGSELAAENQKQAAMLSNRQLISLETLQKDQEMLLQSLEEVSSINSQARQDRIAYINEVGALEDKLLNTLRNK